MKEAHQTVSSNPLEY